MVYNPMESGNPPALFNVHEWTPSPYNSMDYSSQDTIPQHAVSAIAINTTNPTLAPMVTLPDPSKEYHAEWGVIRDENFHPLTLKHQRDFENLFNERTAIQDFYFWQANLGGYCLADMIQATVVSPDGSFVLERRVVEGAPHPGRKKKNKGSD